MVMVSKNNNNHDNCGKSCYLPFLNSVLIIFEKMFFIICIILLLVYLIVFNVPRWYSVENMLAIELTLNF